MIWCLPEEKDLRVICPGVVKFISKGVPMGLLIGRIALGTKQQCYEIMSTSEIVENGKQGWGWVMVSARMVGDGSWYGEDKKKLEQDKRWGGE